MRYQAGHKEEARQRVLAAAGRGFRQHGFGGIGVDGLAQEAGLTSGAFYGHFKSKGAAFEEALAVGLDGLRANIERRILEDGEGWIEKYIDFYLDERRTCDLAEGCALQVFTPDVGRSSAKARTVFEIGMKRVVSTVARGLAHVPEDQRESRAFALMSLLAGSVTVARAMADSANGAQVAEAARLAAKRLIAS